MTFDVFDTLTHGLLAIVAVFIAGGAFIAARRAEHGASTLEQAKVQMSGLQAESNAFLRAQDIYQQSLRDLERRNAQLEERIRKLEAKITELGG